MLYSKIKLFKIRMCNGSEFRTVARNKAEAINKLHNNWRYKLEPSKYSDIDYIAFEESQTVVIRHLALCRAEELGIIEYHTKNNMMIYYESFPYERTTYKVMYNPITKKEIRQPLKSYYKPYKSLIGGKYYANLA